ncbi:MAG: SDR family oxidoreductase [Ectothiorhodospiraceae bacterium AqS1]|nr:SDR family oxidoreductase [Ectothiorhodospiraceae bacterium AqS1]
MNAIDLRTRNAIVTGGAQGIGRSIVERLLDSGARVMIWDKDQDLAESATQGILASREGKGDDLRHSAVDVTDAEAVAGAFAMTVQEFGCVDIMVNNAGIAGPTMPSWEYPLDDWRAVIDVDLNGVYYCARAALPHMRKRNYGRMVNMASIAGKEGNPDACAYSAAKAGVIALTKSLAKETADKDIAVNCITPAAARTRILDQVSPAFIDSMFSKIPRGRFLSLPEAASMVAWMVSEENSFTTGAVFDLSGGRATY